MVVPLILSGIVACHRLAVNDHENGGGRIHVETSERLTFPGLVKTLAYLHGGRALVVGGCEETTSGQGGSCARGLVQMWNLEGARQEKTFHLPRLVTALVVSPDGGKWVAGDVEGRLILSTAPAVPRPFYQKGEITALAFSPDGKWVASGSLDPSFPLGVMDMATGGMVKVRTQFEPVSALAFSPDGKALAVGMSKGRLVVWDFTSNTVPIQIASSGHEGLTITSVAFSPDGTFLAYGRRNGQVVIWDREARQLLIEFNGSSSVTGLTFSSDGQYLAIGQDNGKVLLMESKGAHQIWSKRHAFPVSDLAYSPDGGLLAVATRQHVYVYQVGEAMGLSPLHRARNRESDRGKMLTAVASRTFARVLEISQQEFLRLLPFDCLVESAVRAMVASVPEGSAEVVESPRAHTLVVQANRRTVSVDLARLQRVQGNAGIREAVRAFESVQRFLLESTPGNAVRLENIGVKAVVEELGPSVRLVRLPGKSTVSVRDDAQASDEQSARLLDEGRIPYLKVSRFSVSSARLVDAWLRSVAESHRSAGTPILDLRDNTGGELDPVVQTASLLLPKGQTVASLILRKTGDGVEYRSWGGAPSQGSFVVLVNERTAGTAEMLACAMQDAGVGILVGARTAGVDEVYQTFTLPGGDGLRISTARFDCPNGRSIRWKGQDVDLSVSQVSGAEAVPVGGASPWSVLGPHRPLHMAVGLRGATDRDLMLGIRVALCLGAAHDDGDTTERDQSLTRLKHHLASCGMSPS